MWVEENKNIYPFGKHSVNDRTEIFAIFGLKLHRARAIFSHFFNFWQAASALPINAGLRCLRNEIYKGVTEYRVTILLVQNLPLTLI